MQPVGWHVEVEFQEDDTSTNAAVLLRLPDSSELRARGNAKRNPADPAQPRIGEEIAAARALSDLAHQLSGQGRRRDRGSDAQTDAPHRLRRSQDRQRQPPACHASF